MTLRTLLILGRVSNLPTVWTNLLAGYVIALGTGASAGTSAIAAAEFAVLLVAVSLHYTGGMFLNDAFDAGIDARQRANRPIPMGLAARDAVFLMGGAQLAAGAALLFTISAETGLLGVALAAAILLYDWLHKRTALAPLIMGACRFLVYLTAGAAAGGAPDDPRLLMAAFGLLLYTAGLTYAAKQEALNEIGSAWPLALLGAPVLIGGALAGGDMLAFAILAALAVWSGFAVALFMRRAPGDVPRGVVSLIAGMALYDAALIAPLSADLALYALAGFALTLVFQRSIPGT